MLMPSKYIIKQSTENGIYHVYNRGVEKRDIFCDDHDYKYFLYLLKSYLTPMKERTGLDPAQGPTLQREKPDYSNEIELMAYCLMSNHFHLLLKQMNKDSMSKFMKSVGTNYSMYFNRKYNRVGGLFQGNYKGILVENDDYLLHLSRYIHLNPVAKGLNPAQGPTLEEGLVDWYSSYGDYIGKRNTRWLNSRYILDYFQKSGQDSLNKMNSYKSFVEDLALDDKEYLGRYSID